MNTVLLSKIKWKSRNNEKYHLLKSKLTQVLIVTNLNF